MVNHKLNFDGETNMAKTPATRNKTADKKVSAEKTGIKKVVPELVREPKKNVFEEKYGEGTAFDLDYGKLLIIALCIYIAFQVS